MTPGTCSTETETDGHRQIQARFIAYESLLIAAQSVSALPLTLCPRLPGFAPWCVGWHGLHCEKQTHNHNTYIAPQAATAAATALFRSQTEWAYTVYRPYTKPAPTDYDLQLNSHTPPWSAV